MTLRHLYILFAGMAVGGAWLLFTAERGKPRQTLDVPIVSNRAKIVIGGSLIFFALLFSALLYNHKG